MASSLILLLLSTTVAAIRSANPRLSEYTVRSRGSYAGYEKGNSVDYVIIGGGTAGLTVAARLAQNGNNKVAVIEAGGFYEDTPISNLSVIPSNAIFYAGSSPSDTNPAIDWGFVTTAQTVSRRTDNLDSTRS